MVTGRKAGEAAAELAESRGRAEVSGAEVEEGMEAVMSPLGRDGPEPLVLKGEVGELLWAEAGVQRDADGLESALDEVRRVEEKLEAAGAPDTLKYNHGLLAYLDLRNMLLCSEAVLSSGLHRTESRGAHRRADRPGRDDALYNVTCSLSGGRPSTALSRVPGAPVSINTGPPWPRTR